MKKPYLSIYKRSGLILTSDTCHSAMLKLHIQWVKLKREIERHIIKTLKEWRIIK